MNNGNFYSTLMEINGLLGFRSKSLNKAFSPMSGNASGKFVPNHLTIFSGLVSLSNSAVGANNVQVNVLS